VKPLTFDGTMMSPYLDMVVYPKTFQITVRFSWTSVWTSMLLEVIWSYSGQEFM